MPGIGRGLGGYRLIAGARCFCSSSRGAAHTAGCSAVLTGQLRCQHIKSPKCYSSLSLLALCVLHVAGRRPEKSRNRCGQGG